MSTIHIGAKYRFGEFEVDVGAYELRRTGHRLRLARQPMELLLLLLEHPHELVSRDDIARRLWRPNVYVDLDAGIHTAILKIRQVLGDSRESARYVETVSGKGYRFIAPVEVVAQSARGSPLTLANPPEPRRHNLPAEITSFVGRRKELLELAQAIASSRLVSLTGAGGVGKTRLAVHLGRDLVNEFPDGVWLVDLAPLGLPELVIQTVATVFGVREGPQRSTRDGLLDALRDRELLLVLDTCEHLITACAELVDAVLREAPALRIVATTREALGVSGEIVYRVPSLSVPEVSPGTVEALSNSEATQLFTERARAADPAFTTTPDNADAIVRICRRLDGIPFAIELAAARIVVLSPRQIEARLQDRFRLLTGGARTAVARQRTLEATVDWSYQLLSDVERQLLSLLSVFPATWTLEAAEHVCGGNGIDEHDVLDLLSRLVGKSLVVVDTEFAGTRRYRLLETVRQYARDRLLHAGVADRQRQRHFEFFFNEFRSARSILHGHGQVAMIRRLRVEQENVRTALEWALSSPALANSAVELAGALFWFWTKRGQFQEGRHWLEQALAVSGDAPKTVRAQALIGLGHMHYFQGHYTEFGAMMLEALSLGREAADAWAVSVGQFGLALLAFERGEHEETVRRAREARQAADAGGEMAEHAGPLLMLANVAVLSGDLDRAQQLYDESIEVQRCVGEIWGLSISLSVAAGLRIVRGDFGRARAQASEALALCEELDDPRGIAWSFDVFAGLLAAGGHVDAAARLWGASDGLLDSVKGTLMPPIRWNRDRYFDTVKATIGEESFRQVHADGRTMPVEQAIAFARQQALLLC